MAKIKVKAKELGYFENQRRRPDGTIFLVEENEFSPRWMVKVDENQPVKAVEPKTKKGSKRDVL
jgi:hypothetical protein